MLPLTWKKFLILLILLICTFATAWSQTIASAVEEKRLSAEALTKLSEEMHREVEALRGWKFKHSVDVGIYSVEEVRAFMQGHEEDAAWDEGARSETAFKIVGLMPADCDPEKAFEEAMMAFVPDGIYDHEKKLLRLVEQGEMDPDSLGIRLTLAHELAHALDDQHFGLLRLEEDHGSTSDMSQVLGALIEGSGVTVQERYNIKAKAMGCFDMQQAMKEQIDEIAQMKALFEAPPIVASFMARFPCGIRFLQQGNSRKAMALLMGTHDPGSIGEALKTAMDHPPRSFEQILHPEKYWDSECRDEPVLIDGHPVKRLLEKYGLHVVYEDTLGELFCAILTSPADRTVNPMAMGMPGYWTNEGAKGWGGDHLFLTAPSPVDDAPLQAPQGLRTVWFTMWDSADDCNEFVALYEKHRPRSDRSLLRLGDLGAVFFFEFSEEQRLGMENHLKSTLPACTRDKAIWAWSSQ